MSDLRVAIVAEGPTDAIVIAAALKALLPRPFVHTLLQPKNPPSEMGTGWGGVLRWCLEFAERGYAEFETDPTLPGFDLFVVHIDADVTEMSYGNVSRELESDARNNGWPALPSAFACPPPTGSTDAMRSCILSWTGMSAAGQKTVLCVPSKAIEAWVAAAVLGSSHVLLTGLECRTNMEEQLQMLPLTERIKKRQAEYRAHEQVITSNWGTVRYLCTQAERFSNDIAMMSL